MIYKELRTMPGLTFFNFEEINTILNEETQQPMP